MNFRARVSHHLPLALSCCDTYCLQGGNGVDVQGDSTARDPAHCRDQRTRVTVLRWHVAWTPVSPSRQVRGLS